MNPFRTYKHLLGAFLLALYAFLATPVQYWHHHKTIYVAKQKQASDSQQLFLFQGDGSQQDANCSVCSHKYSTYSEIAILAFTLSHCITGAQSGYYQLPAVTAPSFSLPNKGPPVIFS